MIEAYRQRILAFLARPGMNKQALAELAGIHRNTLADIDRPGWSPNSKTLEALVRVVDHFSTARSATPEV